MQKKSFRNFFLLLFLFLSVTGGILYFLHTNKVNNSFTAMLKAPDADEEIIKIFKKSKVVFLGTDHNSINERRFLAEKIPELYETGLRYVFVEGAGTFEEDNTLLAVFYPWHTVGYRYNSDIFETTLAAFNKGKNQSAQIKIIATEVGRASFSIMYNEEELYTYREEFMLQKIIEVMDTILDSEKGLIIMGGAHGQTEIVKENSEVDKTHFYWKPIGCSLKERYAEEFSSIMFVTLSDTISSKFLNSEKWKKMDETPKLLYPMQMQNMTKISKNKILKGFDNYIVQKTTETGLLHSYAAFDDHILEEMLRLLKESNFRIKKIAKLDYTDGGTYYLLSDYLRSIYYIKLYFGESFPYSLWNPSIPLEEAIILLEKEVFSGMVKPSEKIAISLPQISDLLEYQNQMHNFLSLRAYEIKGSVAHWFSIAKSHMALAMKIFPDDLWTLYWFAYMYTEQKKYEEALVYWKKLLDLPLVRSMQIYPQSLELAIVCAEKLKRKDLVSEYTKTRSTLWNEHAIDVNQISLFIE